MPASNAYPDVPEMHTDIIVLVDYEAYNHVDDNRLWISAHQINVNALGREAETTVAAQTI